MLYHYPSTAKVDKTIPKNKFYQRGSANHRIERLFVEQVDSIRWAYKLSPHTINLNDSERCIARCYSDNLGQTMHVNTGAEQNHD